MPEIPRPVRLLSSPRAPSPRRVTIFMAEKGIELPVEHVDIMAGEHFQEPYLERVGRPIVPAMEFSDGTILTETVAICRYFEDTVLDPNLMGSDPVDAAIVEMWQRRVEQGLLMPIAQVLRHTNPHMAVLEKQVPAWGDANRERVQTGLETLDARLSETPFIAGDRFTIADITAIVSIDFMRTIRHAIPDTATHLLRWQDTVRSRPSMAA